MQRTVAVYSLKAKLAHDDSRELRKNGMTTTTGANAMTGSCMDVIR